MKYLFTILSLGFILLSCNRKEPPIQHNPKTPKALQEKQSDCSLVSKRSYDDLVQSLYLELVNKSPALQELENKVASLDEMGRDSLYVFRKFDQQNISYYNSANEYIKLLKSESIKSRMNAIIDSSRFAYNKKIARHNSLSALIDTNSVSLTDMHIMLKLVKTLPLIEKYQSDDLPSTTPIEKALRQYVKTIQRLDSASRQ